MSATTIPKKRLVSLACALREQYGLDVTSRHVQSTGTPNHFQVDLGSGQSLLAAILPGNVDVEPATEAIADARAEFGNVMPGMRIVPDLDGNLVHRTYHRAVAVWTNDSPTGGQDIPSVTGLSDALA
jgi:hypothetical protein